MSVLQVFVHVDLKVMVTLDEYNYEHERSYFHLVNLYNRWSLFITAG
jgi:hypothetical protein